MHLLVPPSSTLWRPCQVNGGSSKDRIKSWYIIVVSLTVNVLCSSTLSVGRYRSKFMLFVKMCAQWATSVSVIHYTCEYAA
jgi:hypothetical protein